MIVKNEILRKSIHFLTFVLPISYHFIEKEAMLYFSGSLVIIALMVETARFLWKPFSKIFYRLTESLLRRHEKKDLTGATYLFIGAFLAILLFDKWIAQTVILFLVISDGLSALVGRLWGKYKIFGQKTLEGSITFLISAIIIVIIMSKVPLYIGISGALAALGVDTFVLKIDDNITIPLAGGGVMQILCLILS